MTCRASWNGGHCDKPASNGRYCSAHASQRHRGKPYGPVGKREKHDASNPFDMLAWKRAYRARLVRENVCTRCLKPHENGYPFQTCQKCRVQQNAEKRERFLGTDNVEPISAADRRIARDIREGRRCAVCQLLAPCYGHETLSINWHASRRFGSNTGS